MSNFAWPRRGLRPCSALGPGDALSSSSFPPSRPAVGDASPALFVFKVECWCLIASAENTPGLKNNATIIIVIASVILFEITEDCRRLHDDLISSLRNAFSLLRRESGSLCGRVSLFSRGTTKKSKCNPKHFGSKMKNGIFMFLAQKRSHM